MSYENGWAALNMQFSPKIPRTEYSADGYHWKLMEAVTGIDTSVPENRPAASRAFRKSWDYSFVWSILVERSFMKEAGAVVTDMGHAVYGEDDFNTSVTHPYQDPEDVYALDPAEQFRFFDQKDLIARFERHYRNNCENIPDVVNMSGVYITMFSGLIDLLGWEALLLSLGTDVDRFNRLADSYYHWIRQFFEALAKSSVPVAMVHDDLCWTSGPVASPEWYRQQIFPKIASLIGILKEAGKIVMFTSDGKIDEFFDDIVRMNVDSVVMEPCCDMERFAATYGDRVGFVGGVDCRTLTYGSYDEIRFEVERAMGWGRRYPGFMLAVGNHLPADVPVERALYYNDLYEKLAYR